jgi:DNA-binding transcriptional LysR family regulator
MLGDAIRSFQRASRAKLRVLTRDRDRALDAVRLGEAHLAVTVLDEVPDEFIAKPVARVGSAVVLPKTHRLAEKRSVSIAELDGEPLIVPAEGRPQRAALAKAWADAGAAWQPAVEANGWELILHFARLGLGIAVVNDFCRAPSGMVMKPLRGLPTLQYQVLRRRGRVYSETAAALERTILELV